MTLRNWRGRPKVLMGETLAYASALALPFPVPPCVMDANSILNRLRDLRWEIRELQELNTRYRSQQRPSPAETKARELGCSRMAEIKAGLTTTIESRYSHATISRAKRKLATRMPGTLPLIRCSLLPRIRSVTLRLGLGPSQEITPLGSVHIAAKHLAEHALNGCFSVRFAGKHAPPPSRFLDTNFTPGSPDARNVTTRAACCRFNHDVLREFPVPCLTAQAAPAFGHIAGDRRPSSLRSCLRPKD